MKLEIQILTKNNEATIEKTLQSICSLKAPIVIGDLGSSDLTLEICKKYKTIVHKIKFEDNYSKAKNYLISQAKSAYIFSIEPWEILVKVGEDLSKLTKKAYNINLIEANVLNREIRVFNKSCQFINPVYEQVNCQSQEILNLFVCSKNKPLPEDYILETWMRESPTNINVYYFMAMNKLKSGLFTDFLSLAKHYLFIQDKETDLKIKCRYYQAMVLLYIENNKEECIKSIIKNILLKPAMAEFWCLLGDAYYQLNNFVKAYSFYENALIIGNKRKNDLFFTEIKKYKEYPKEMMENCKKMLNFQVHSQ